jgi:hypothetical protein
MLGLVDRIIVVANHIVIMDGPKSLVLEKLNGANSQKEQVMNSK